MSCLSVSCSSNMSSNLTVLVSHSLFIVIPHTKFSALQGMHSPSALSQPCVKIKPEHAEMKLPFICLMSCVTYSMQSELHWWHKLFTMLVTMHWSTVDNFLWLQYNRTEKTYNVSEFGTYNITSKYMMWKLMYTVCNIHSWYMLVSSYIFISQENVLWTMR
jgi:hypothetical protein